VVIETHHWLAELETIVVVGWWKQDPALLGLKHLYLQFDKNPRILVEKRSRRRLERPKAEASSRFIEKTLLM